MATTEEIITKYRIDVGEAVDGLNTIQREAKQTDQALTSAFGDGTDAAKRFDTELKRQPKTISALELKLRNLRELYRDDAKIGTKAFRDVATEIRKTEAQLDKLNASTKSSQGTISSFGASLKSFGAAVGIAFSVDQVIRFGSASIKAASDLDEVLTKSQELFGNSTQLVVDFSKSAANSIGQSQTSALNAASSFAIFGKAAGLSGDNLAKFSTDFTVLASDLASFNNTTPEEAITAIGAALRGESEPIRRYGVLLDEATLRQKALELGIISTTKQALTPQQRVLAAQKAIYEQTSVAQGDFARTSEGLANQQRILAANIENLKVTIGTGLLPVVSEVIKAINDAVGEGDFNGLIDLAEQIKIPIAGVRDVIDDFRAGDIKQGVIGTLKEMLNTIFPFITQFEKITSGFRNLFRGEFKAALGDLVQGFVPFGTAIANATGLVKENEQALVGAQTQTQKIDAALRELNKSIKVSAADFEALLAITRQFKVDADNTAASISYIATATDEQLDVLFKKSAAYYGVTRKAFDEYVAKIRQIKKENEDSGKTVEKLAGPYQQIIDRIAKLNQEAKDQSAIGEIQQRVIDELAAAYDELATATQRQNDALIQGNVTTRENIELVKLQSVTQAEGLALLDREVELQERLNRAKAEGRDADEIEIRNKEKLKPQAGKSSEEEKAKKANEAQTDLNGTLSQTADLLGNLGETFAAVSDLTTALGIKDAGFQKGLALFMIQIKLAESIANVIANATKASVTPIELAAQIAIGITAVTSAIAQSIGILNGAPEPQAAFTGTDFVRRQGHPKGIDTVPFMLTEGEAVIPARQNAKYPGLSRAFIDDNLDAYLMSNFVAPVLEKQKKDEQADFAKNIANSLMLNSSFDDYRLYRTGEKGNNLLGSMDASLRELAKNRNNKRNK